MVKSHFTVSDTGPETVCRPSMFFLYAALLSFSLSKPGAREALYSCIVHAKLKSILATYDYFIFMIIIFFNILYF